VKYCSTHSVVYGLTKEIYVLLPLAYKRDRKEERQKGRKTECYTLPIMENDHL